MYVGLNTRILEDKKALIKKFKSELKKEIENKSALIFPYDFNKTFKKDTLSINSRDKKIGEIIIRQLTGNSQRFGAVSSFVIEGRILSSSLIDDISRMKLSFVDLELIHSQGLFYLYSGYLKNKAYFKDHGVISFYINDNIEEKVLEMIMQINSFFSVRMFNIYCGNILVIDDILSNHTFYTYPTTLSAIVCKVNNRMDLVKSIINNCKNGKMKDATRNNINEILNGL